MPAKGSKGRGKDIGMANSFRRRSGHRIASLLRRLWADEAGGEVIEWALIAGLISVAAIAVIASVGTKVLARWNSVNSTL
jgi:Flp pilus assembly pilin Flp